CLSSHSRCAEAQADVHPPSRLIKVGSQENARPRLIYPSTRVDYAAVSHCWGESKSILLTKANHDRLVDGFNDDELPRLFQDCVLVARRLDIEHVWIDTLCIIQDSKEDWTYEASRMGDVYRGSTVTISAVAA
ncbi:hypothetical protein K491DRAFT_555876, partial [Lophiostoma macrostomum CBS 122681]